jgi:hypothetical protein
MENVIVKNGKAVSVTIGGCIIRTIADNALAALNHNTENIILVLHIDGTIKSYTPTGCGIRTIINESKDVRLAGDGNILAVRKNGKVAVVNTRGVVIRTY